LATFFFLTGMFVTSFVQFEFDRSVFNASQVRSAYFFFFLAAFLAGFLHGMDDSPPRYGAVRFRPIVLLLCYLGITILHIV
jgi:hypothetical protein